VAHARNTLLAKLLRACPFICANKNTTPEKARKRFFNLGELVVFLRIAGI
jgi:hypothetical protein